MSDVQHVWEDTEAVANIIKLYAGIVAGC